MSAAIDQIGTNLSRVRARLTAMHWGSEERKATLACIAAMGRGNRLESQAHEAWAEVCAERARAWKEEEAKP